MTEAIMVPEVGNRDIMFPSRALELLPKWEELTREEQSMSGPFCHAAAALFHGGGTLAQQGLFPKPGVDLDKVMRFLRATLPDWGPKHEHKIGGVGQMLAKWCDHKPAARHAKTKGRRR